MSFLTVKNIEKCLNTGQTSFTLQNLSFEIEKGQTVALLGESGCGKTTFLKILAGFIEPDSGTLVLDDTELTGSRSNGSVPVEKREVGYVFQNYALFPHLSVKSNVTYGVTNPDREKINDLVSWLGIKDQLNKYPHELSGGQQQRVALARTLATNPKLLCLDEPLSNIDQGMKQVVRDQLKLLIKEKEITTVIVSHDITDAIQLADKILVIKNGCMQQFGTSQELFDAPANLYVAKLMGNWQEIEGDGTITKIGKNISIGNGPYTGEVISQKYNGQNFDTSVRYKNKKLTGEFSAADSKEVKFGFEDEKTFST